MDASVRSVDSQAIYGVGFMDVILSQKDYSCSFDRYIVYMRGIQEASHSKYTAHGN